jgi:hypothetical protein
LLVAPKREADDEIIPGQQGAGRGLERYVVDTVQCCETTAVSGMSGT